MREAQAPSAAKDVRVADALAEVVHSAGATYAFGHPGGEVAVLIDALDRAGTRFILTHHETTAGFMAGAFGEITGLPGACVATLGPGATNLVTGVASALLDRAPLIALTAASSQQGPAGYTHQRLDLTGLFSPVSKTSIALDQSNLSQVRAAVELTTTGRHGPIHVSVPSDVASAALSEDAPMLDGPEMADRGTRHEVAEAVAMLNAASRPAIIAGLGAMRSGAGEAVRALAERLGAPVAVTPKAKGLLDERHELFLGVIEMAGDDVVVDELAGADVVVAIGLDAVELDKPWRCRGSVIHIDTVPNDDPYYDVSAELAGDISENVERLMAGLESKPAQLNRVRSCRQELLSYVQPSGAALQPWQVVTTIRRHLGYDAVAASDVGAHKFVVGQLWQTSSPQTFFMSNGLSSMGYGIPTAAVSSLLRPERPAVALVGDGGISMYLGELETLLRMGVNLLIVVFADASLELIRRSQVKQGLPPTGTGFGNPDFTSIGRAFGIRVWEADSAKSMDEAAAQAASSMGVRLIAAHIDGADYRL